MCLRRRVLSQRSPGASGCVSTSPRGKKYRLGGTMTRVKQVHSTVESTAILVFCLRSSPHEAADVGDQQATENKELVARSWGSPDTANFRFGTPYPESMKHDTGPAAERADLPHLGGVGRSAPPMLGRRGCRANRRVRSAFHRPRSTQRSPRTRRSPRRSSMHTRKNPRCIRPLRHTAHAMPPFKLSLSWAEGPKNLLDDLCVLGDLRVERGFARDTGGSRSIPVRVGAPFSAPNRTMKRGRCSASNHNAPEVVLGVNLATAAPASQMTGQAA